MKLTMAELHELVWSQPMTEIARQFSVRDRHVAKVCDGTDITRPRLGYWQKVEYDKLASRLALR